MFADLKQHGNTRWVYDVLLRTSLFWMMSERRNWQRRFQEVVRVWTAGDDQTLTFQGFLKAVRREYSVMTERMNGRLREIMLDITPGLRQVAGRDIFAVDGTSLELPRTLANQEFFCGDNVDIANESGSKCSWKLTPQMHLTTLWHIGLALPLGLEGGPRRRRRT